MKRLRTTLVTLGTVGGVLLSGGAAHASTTCYLDPFGSWFCYTSKIPPVHTPTCRVGSPC
jgi:hypothetical protein